MTRMGSEAAAPPAAVGHTDSEITLVGTQVSPCGQVGGRGRKSRSCSLAGRRG